MRVIRVEQLLADDALGMLLQAQRNRRPTAHVSIKVASQAARVAACLAVVGKNWSGFKALLFL